jgi:hypothetical protein
VDANDALGINLDADTVELSIVPERRSLGVDEEAV